MVKFVEYVIFNLGDLNEKISDRSSIRDFISKIDFGANNISVLRNEIVSRIKMKAAAEMKANKV
jgi:hypothetical protein